MNELCKKLMDDPKMTCLYFAIVLALVILIVMQVWKVGYYRSNAAEKLTSSGVEIPPNYVCNTGYEYDVIPNQYVYGSGGMTRGAAGRHGQVPSDYSGMGRMPGYVYTTRLDDNTRSYQDVNSPVFDLANPGLYTQ